MTRARRRALDETVSMVGTLDRARDAFARRAWGEACKLLGACSSLLPEDLERLAVAACLTGDVDTSDRAWERAHLAFARRGDHADAARCACWLATGLMLRGETAPANGWFARATRLVEGPAGGCPARGYLLLPAFLSSLGEGDSAATAALANEMGELAHQFDDPDLVALATLCRGEALLAVGETSRGLMLLDEAMVAITTAEMSPILEGIVYCAVIEACVDAFDFRRAAQWTSALERWCDAQPDLVPYRGQCLVHKSQVLQARGEWVVATAVAKRAAEHLAATAHPATGFALYQVGELQRLQGDLERAERSYRAATHHGHDPFPGLALLRLAQGSPDAAVAAIHRIIEERRGHLDGPALLAAAVEILLAAGDTARARTAAEDLAKAAAANGAELLFAMSQFATGAVLCTEGDFASGLAALRIARRRWVDLDMPYEVSRASILIAQACEALSDLDTAGMELESACATFERVGATADLRRAQRLLTHLRTCSQGPLTAREREVLRLVATGRSNRQIADVLVISEHTVGRHLQNIFAKLELSSRTAAAAYAYEHDLA